MSDSKNNIEMLEQEALDFIRRRESARVSQNEFSIITDEFSSIAETWNAFELLDTSEFPELTKDICESQLLSKRSTAVPASLFTQLKYAYLSLERKIQVCMSVGALGAVIAVLCVLVILPDYYDTPQEYRVNVGEHLAVTLDDGSSITLYSGSVARVTENYQQRKVVLTTGTAFFTVAKNKKKPFTVTAGNTIVTVLGTEFSVYHDSAVTEVVVLEGKVNVQNNIQNVEINKTLVNNQKISIFSNQTFEFKENIDLARELSWKSGKMNFHDDSLGNIVNRMNHYYKKPISLRNEKLSSLRLTGSFLIDDKESFIKTLNEITAVQIKEEATSTVLY